MLPEQKIEISKARFDHAKECLQDVKLLLTGGSYRSAANRAYYGISCNARSSGAGWRRHEAPQRHYLRVPQAVYQDERL